MWTYFQLAIPVVIKRALTVNLLVWNTLLPDDSGQMQLYDTSLNFGERSPLMMLR
jgi:hypothetical protein